MSAKTVKGPLHSMRAYGCFTDAGKVRPLNEDHYLVAPEQGLFSVADGYGGNGVGDQTAKSSLEKIAFFVKNGLGDSEVTLPFIFRHYYTESGNLLFNAFHYANEGLYLENQQKTINGRGGASALVALAQGRRLTLANFGLCQAFLVRRGRCQSLLRPRSYNAMRGVFQGSWQNQWAFPLVGLGHARDLEPEIVDVQLEKGDLVILATDGIYAQLNDEDFQEYYQILIRNRSVDLAIEEQNRRLAEIAGQKGGDDNQALVTLLCG